MITIGMNYKVIPGKDEEFTSVFTKVMGIMDGIDGHDTTHLFRDVHDEHSYLVVSEWSSQDAFDAFIASDRFKNVADWGKANILAGRPTHEVYGKDSAPPSGCPASR
jgi:heme-degrading monooxygenase HmoA